MDTFADEVLKATEEEIPDRHEGAGIPISAVFRATDKMRDEAMKAEEQNKNV